ncbi:MAG: 1-deoxy-D-xylulose-5-phosphate synthase [Nocardioidaceae bacterium]|nr:1-deoxy-D-xylulose-5-phosphate synthase [Nocardioidaceae bacterium]MDQ3325434.1 1-deoxy-D-xylulose-5-phosphate synthase [Actinomycetota bacterium]
MGLLDGIAGPGDLRTLSDAELDDLAEEIRERIVSAVAHHGGHLGPNLGVVELTLALHRVFDSPRDRVLFDTGHQAYVHKMVTGRAAAFDRLRQQGGLSGYPSREESDHDTIENSHASTSLSYADGLAKAYAVRGVDRHVVAVIGDGALTGGMAWEALNTIAAGKDRPLVVVVNDNGRSYAPTAGGLAARLAETRTNPRYETTLNSIKGRLNRVRFVGPPTYGALHAVKRGLKDAIAPQGLFEDLGLKYVGPVDGHDRKAVERALDLAKKFGGPVLVHVVTEKGHGYARAVAHEVDQMHQSYPFDPDTGESLATPVTTWTHVFRDEIAVLAAERDDIVGVTAAMLQPTGLDAFADKFPDRVYDVGIAEQHAVTSAAGLALGGVHPVVAIYATFLNRAFDQTLLDVALHGCGVTFVLDRAGLTGEDGPSHNGMWDLSLLAVVPSMRVAAPRDGSRLRELLREAVAVDDAPTAVRFPKGAVPADLDPIDNVDGVDVLVRPATVEQGRRVLIVAAGAMAHVAVEAAELLGASDEPATVTVVDPRWVLPVAPLLIDLARDHDLVVTVEDNGRAGGFGSAVCSALVDAEVDTPVVVRAVPQQFHAHAKPAVLRERAGLSPRGVADAVSEWLSRHS